MAIQRGRDTKLPWNPCGMWWSSWAVATGPQLSSLAPRDDQSRYLLGGLVFNGQQPAVVLGGWVWPGDEYRLAEAVAGARCGVVGLGAVGEVDLGDRVVQRRQPPPRIEVDVAVWQPLTVGVVSRKLTYLVAQRLPGDPAGAGDAETGELRRRFIQWGGLNRAMLLSS